MRRTPVLALLVLVPVLSLLAACGASGGDGRTSAGNTSSTSSTTAEEGDARSATSADLADILPTVEDIGEGYEVSDEDLDDTPAEPTDDDSATADPTQKAILEACPGAKILDELDSGSSDNADEVSREFSTDADATVEVSLDPTVGTFTAENADKVVQALADCGTIKTTDEDGAKIEMTIEAEPTEEHGDYGLKMTMEATFELMGAPVNIEFRGLIFSVDGTVVSVVATSGLDDATFQFVPGDYDLVPDLATEMQDRVAAL